MKNSFCWFDVHEGIVKTVYKDSYYVCKHCDKLLSKKATGIMSPKFRFLHWLPIIGLFTVPIFEFDKMEIPTPWLLLNGVVHGFYIVCTIIALIYFTTI